MQPRANSFLWLLSLPRSECLDGLGGGVARNGAPVAPLTRVGRVITKKLDFKSSDGLPPFPSDKWILAPAPFEQGATGRRGTNPGGPEGAP